MKAEDFISIIGADFYTGVPDSQLKPLCDCLMSLYGTDTRHHVIAANEGNAAALAAGYHLATGKIPVVYLQNSGEGNIINPAASLLNKEVYAIPVIFVVGWRGEPGIHDEPQHIYQGKITLRLLDDMGIKLFVLDAGTRPEELRAVMEDFTNILASGGDVAFAVRKGALSYNGEISYKNDNSMLREEAIRHIVSVSGDDPIICTTGKASRELFEIREANGQGHQRDFLTVGSMGHCSSIALGIALHKPQTKVWCIDGDGAALMHMGALAVIGTAAPKNLVHIVINNGAHESVGGMPTAAGRLDMASIAKTCGYPYTVSAGSLEVLDMELTAAKERDELSFIEVKCAIGARASLGRPTTTALENKLKFMEYQNGRN